MFYLGKGALADVAYDFLRFAITTHKSGSFRASFIRVNTPRTNAYNFHALRSLNFLIFDSDSLLES